MRRAQVGERRKGCETLPCCSTNRHKKQNHVCTQKTRSHVHLDRMQLNLSGVLTHRHKYLSHAPPSSVLPRPPFPACRWAAGDAAVHWWAPRGWSAWASCCSPGWGTLRHALHACNNSAVNQVMYGMRACNSCVFLWGVAVHTIVLFKSHGLDFPNTLCYDYPFSWVTFARNHLFKKL